MRFATCSSNASVSSIHGSLIGGDSWLSVATGLAAANDAAAPRADDLEPRVRTEVAFHRAGSDVDAACRVGDRQSMEVATQQANAQSLRPVVGQHNDSLGRAGLRIRRRV